MLKENLNQPQAISSVSTADLEIALHNSSDLVFIKDIYNNILFVNEAACIFFEKDQEQIIGESCNSLLTEEDSRKYYKDDLKIIESKKPICKIVESFTHTNGTKSIIITDKLPILNTNGQVEKILVIRKSLEKQNTEVKQLALKLKESSRKFDELRYLFSHDLLEPIRMISSFIDLIEPIIKSYKIKDEKLNKYFSFVKESSLKLKKIVSRTRSSLKK